MILIEKLNNCYIRIHTTEPAIKEEICDFFSYTKPGFITTKAQFTWLMKHNMKQPLFNTKNGTLPVGLMPDLLVWLRKNNYEYKIEGKFNQKNFSEVEALDFIKTLNLPEKYVIRDYQLKYFIKCVRNQRAIVVSPTNSGKSLVIYLLFRYFNQKTLLTVPTTNLVLQMHKDFENYGYDVETNVHLLQPGESKTTDKLLTITCWQSIYTQDRNFFKDFRVVFGDEVHSDKAKSLLHIMNMMTETPVRIGLTGTLYNEPLYDKQIQGAFGPVIKYVSNDELIEQGFSSHILIKAIELHHNIQMELPMDYQDEMVFLLSQTKRNDFFVNLALSLKGNTFLMFRIKEHGKVMYEGIKERATCPVYYIDGTMTADKRMELKELIEKSDECIVVTSVVFTTGVDISCIHNIIFSHPAKSRIRVLQSIGRGLRVSVRKKYLTLFDISDVVVDGLINTTWRHAKERAKMYQQENFPVKNYTVTL